MQPATFESLVDSQTPDLWQIETRGPGPQGALPLTDELLRNAPSGDLFGLTQNAGMGWPVAEVLRPQYLILSTQGGIRGEDGRPIALGYHTGHYEVGLLMRAAAEEIDRLEGLPFAGYVSDPCDGRTQGTTGMMDSLPYRNDAAIVLRRLIRSLPVREGVVGVATCDKGLPAMMMALASMHDLPCVIVPGGVTLPPVSGEDTGKVQSIGARYAKGEISLEHAAEAGCRACGSAGGGCQFLGTAATSQIVAEALGMSLPHAALAPSGQPIWLDIAVRSARAVVTQRLTGLSMNKILTADSLHNAMVVHAACGGSTNLLLHIPAIAFAAGLERPKVEEWNRINLATPRLVDCLPNGPVGHPTVRFFLAGGVPELMLHLRALGLLKLNALTATGKPLGDVLEWWEKSERRERVRQVLHERDGVDPDDVVMPPALAKARGLTSTVCFPRGNIAPEGSVVKATSIDKSTLDANGVYHKIGRVRFFATEREAIRAVKGQSQPAVQAGDILILAGRGPLGCGMEETYQITSSLRYLPFGKEVTLITDARFSGVSTGACIGHVGPEALAGGPIGKLRDNDLIEVRIDTRNLTGSINFIGEGDATFTAEHGARILAGRTPHPKLAPDPELPADTRLWAALQQLGGGTWGGCVYDVDAIVNALANAPRMGTAPCSLSGEGSSSSNPAAGSSNPESGTDLLATTHGRSSC
ncbi:dehydratase, YjhG/YagF family [Planctopirus limnophila DSM 3776]|uniref:Dehydratase, YjhG/YagF family n=1 Tax=Planctopirus limnophila (strain ATCC 43296 / DSM 3776 / IFAM 1008 / Mu 290) TaxID=521674 RepID=D5SWJ0_PLAL2|nr:YjhG/YagF family D-xylonate dehydratase [Planctopirus limnophila]ADG69583.1 dehydratase, YjhG/YagF family [Planctopirus limnophila DSM 3776]